jgi:hypothetical protein
MERFNRLSEDSKDQNIDMEFYFNQEVDFIYETGGHVWMESKPSSRVLTTRDFTIQGESEREILVEIFFDPTLYDLEVLIESRDAIEVRSKQFANNQMKHNEIDYKGSKKIYAELEPGDYTFYVIAKVPGAHQEINHLIPSHVEFQLYMVTGFEIIDLAQKE